MRVAVIGAGIVGVTSAYELAADGHDVTVFERRGSVAAETSFANAGVIAPGYVTPWAAPGMPGKVLRHLFSKHSPVRVNPTLDLATLGWMWRWWRASSLHSFRANRSRMQRLALFSRDRLHKLTATLQLEYERTDGYLVLWRTARDAAHAQAGIAMLHDLGIRFETLDAAQCRRVEPGLNPDTPLHGGLYLPNDEVGNCRQFAGLMRAEAQRLGARFNFHSTVSRIEPGLRPQLTHLQLSADESTLATPSSDSGRRSAPPAIAEPQTQTFDAIVVCAAMGAPQLLTPHGLRLPLAPVYGYSVTAPLRHHEAHPDVGPRSALMDERYKVAVSRMGSRVRVAGSAELGGSAQAMNKGSLDTLYKVLNDWFPGAARMSQAQRWKGARPMLPDGPPVLGASGLAGIWLNLGHGSSGWALACGSARVLADQLAQRAPAIDIDGLGIERLRR